MDIISIRRVVAVISIFSLATMSIGTSPVFGEDREDTAQKNETISPLLEKEPFVISQADIFGTGQLSSGIYVESFGEDAKNIQEEKMNQDKDTKECRVEIPKKQIIPCVKKDRIVTKELTVTATAYSSTAAQTDSSPCTTANGFNVCKADKENVIAANFLPFGTKVQFPEIYGDKIFTVQDRMHKRFSKRVDFWMKTTNKARKFGVKKVKVQVVEELLAQNF